MTISTLTSSTCHSTDQLISLQTGQSTSSLGRYLVFGLLFFGAFTTKLSRINFNATIVELSRSNGTNGSTIYKYYKLSLSGSEVNQSSEPGQIKQWSESQEDTLNSAFLAGYSLALIPISRLGSKLSTTKRVAAVGGVLRILANLLTPTAVESSYCLLFILRATMGAACSTTVPAFFDLIQQAVPPGEKSKGIASLKIGSSLGCIFMHSVLLGAIKVIGKAASWSALYYLCAGLDLVWLLLWVALVKEVQRGDNLDVFKTSKSSCFLTKLLRSNWSHLFALTSLLPMVVMVAAKLANVWLETLLVAKLPQYFTSVLRLDVAQTTLLCGLFSAVSLVSISFSGTVADWMTKRAVCSLTVLRKAFEGVASLGIVIGMLLLAIYGDHCTPTLSLALILTTFAAINAAFGLVTAGSSTIIIDMTAEGDTSLIALLYTLTTVFGFCAPHLMTGILNASDSVILSKAAHSSASWSSVFYATALIYAVSGLLFSLFASSEKQQWRKKGKSNRNSDNKVET